MLNKFRSNWQYRIMALVMAVFFWYLISGQDKVEMWLEVPVEIANLSEDLSVRSGMVDKVRIRCRATRTMLSRIETGRLVYHLDLSGVEQGSNTINLDPKRIDLPRAVQPMEITPARLELEVDRIVARELPVRINWRGSISSDYLLHEIIAEPESIRVRGPERLVRNMDAIETKTVQVDESSPGTVVRRIGLQLHPEVESQVAEVNARLEFIPVLEEIWVRKSIEVRNAEGLDYNLEQDYIRANLALPKTILKEPGWREQISYYINLDKGMLPGIFELPVQTDLPDHARVLEKRPETVKVIIK